jgi:HAD superfamily phosphoserine phosphatase-like hydrolase
MPTLKPRRIILFDLDGTLTYGISTTRFIFRKLSREAIFKKIEEEWLAEKTTHLKLARVITRLMAGWKMQDIEKALRLIPKMNHITFTVRALRKRGYFVALATLGYEFSAVYFKKWYGFDEVRGTTIEIKNGAITGRGVKIFQEHEKALYLKSLSKRFRIPLSKTVVLGDSRSDREVFKIAGLRIALNHDGFLRDKADAELKCRDLRKILACLSAFEGESPTRKRKWDN